MVAEVNGNDLASANIIENPYREENSHADHNHEEN